MRVKGVKTLLKSRPQGHSTAVVLSLVAVVTDNDLLPARLCVSRQL